MSMLYSNGRARTPQGMKVAPQSYTSLEAVAEGTSEYLPKMAANSFRLDSARILEKTMRTAGYEYKIAEVEELEECAAFTIPERGIIVFREDIYDDLQADRPFGRSTVIHEMSHIVLEHAVTLARGASLGEHRFFEDSEWQAKALTAALMMPIKACEVANDAEELAAMCGTSIQAATFRLDNLRKHGKLKGQRSMFY